jgi:hypothetical protein
MAGTNPEDGMKLLLSGLSSDFTIVCQGMPFKVHKAILYAGSQFFKAMLGGDWVVCIVL